MGRYQGVKWGSIEVSSEEVSRCQVKKYQGVKEGVKGRKVSREEMSRCQAKEGVKPRKVSGGDVSSI